MKALYVSRFKAKNGRVTDMDVGIKNLQATKSPACSFQNKRGMLSWSFQ